MGNIILCDIDGTVADNSHRQHFLEGKKDWEGFFSNLVDDIPILPVIEHINKEHNRGKEIFFVTGRPQRYKYGTSIWLATHFKFELNILMRPDGDQRNKLKVKEDIFKKSFTKQQIDYVIDNDDDLILMWTKIGIKAKNVKEFL